ncbi:MAG: hypothetical protein ACPG4X_14610 [Pikeienuella sp.]
MAEYGKVETGFWGWARRCHLSDEARQLALYLLTCPHRNSIGVYYLPDGYVLSDLGWSLETVSERFMELFQNRFVYRCERTDFVFIRDHISHNPPSNPNVTTSMLKLVQAIPSDFSYWTELKEKLKQLPKPYDERFLNSLPNGSLNPFETRAEQSRAEQSSSTRDSETVSEQEEKGAEQPRTREAEIDASGAVDDVVTKSDPVKTKPPDPHPATAVIELFDEVLAKTFGAEQARPWKTQDDLPAARKILETARGDMALIRGVFESRMQSMQANGRQPPGTVKYFVDAVADALVDVPSQFRRSREPKRHKVLPPHNPVIADDDGNLIEGDEALRRLGWERGDDGEWDLKRAAEG